MKPKAQAVALNRSSLVHSLEGLMKSSASSSQKTCLLKKPTNATRTPCRTSGPQVRNPHLEDDA